MSLRASLSLFFGLLLAVLLIALAGFYWAVERSLTDQELLRVARAQFDDMESLAVNSRRQIEETENLLLLGNTDLKTIAGYREKAEASLQRILELVLSELRMLPQYDKDGNVTREWRLETSERDKILRIQAIYKELCEASDAVVAKRQDLGREELLRSLRDIDTGLDKRFAPLLEGLMGTELEEALLREQTMLRTARTFEKIAFGACGATFLIVLAGVLFLRRAFEDLARKEGAEAADRAKSDFLANMSHEIRTPMTAILGFTDILIQDVVDPEKINAATIVKRNGEHLLEIINDILDLSKIDAGQLVVDSVLCSPWQIVADTVSLMRVRAAAKGLDLSVEFRGLIPETILTSPVRLRQILINLIGNAVKFTEVGGVRLVTQLVRDKKGEPQLRFDVIDSGVGISKDGVAGLFKPFMQADTSTMKASEGTGLGLAISKRLANLLGGDIEVASVPEKGSKFSVTIRTGALEGVKMIDHVREVGSQSDAAAAYSADREHPQLNGRILLVEDGPDNQRLISFLLRRAGAEVTLAENGLVALEKIQQAIEEAASRGEPESKAPFDVILMDMQMPVMDGYVVTQRLRRMGYHHPIVALTAYAMSADRQKCLDAGCDDYATKPISETVLLKTLAAHMQVERDATTTP